MCPDDQILSAYYDGEVPEPWDDKIEEHLNSCSQCREKLSQHEVLTHNLRQTDDFLEVQLPLSMERVYARILDGAVREHPRFWQRQVKIPVPFLAAAAAMVVFFGIGYLTGRGRADVPAAVPIAEESSSSEVLTLHLDDGDMSDLASLLKDRDEQVQVFIELPPASFIDAGDEAQLIRAADYRP